MDYLLKKTDHELFKSTLCLTTLYIIYSFGNWLIYWDTKFHWYESYQELTLLLQEMLILLGMSFMQITYSSCINFRNALKIMTIYMAGSIYVLCLFKVFRSEDARGFLYILLGLLSGFVMPCINTICAKTFTNTYLNLVFCLLTFSFTNLKVFFRVMALWYLEKGFMIIFLFDIVTVVFLVGLVIIAVANKSESRSFLKEDIYPQYGRIIGELALCAFLGQFAEYYMIHETSEILGQTGIRFLAFAEIMKGILGFFIDLLITLVDFFNSFEPNAVLKAILTTQIFGYVLFFIDAQINNEEVTGFGAILWIGLFFTSCQTFLMGLLAVRAGIKYNAVGDKTGYVIGFGNLGKVLSALMLFSEFDETLRSDLVKIVTVMHSVLVCKLIITTRGTFRRKSVLPN